MYISLLTLGYGPDAEDTESVSRMAAGDDHSVDGDRGTDVDAATVQDTGFFQAFSVSKLLFGDDVIQQLAHVTQPRFVLRNGKHVHEVFCCLRVYYFS